jgi:hypothetical protein
MVILRETEKPCVVCRNRSMGFQPVGLTGVSPVDSASKMLAGPTDKMSVPRVDEELRYLPQTMVA